MGKCLIVCESLCYGNTAKVANAMAETAKARLCRAAQLKSLNLEKYEIIGFGSGIAYGRHYDTLLKAVGQLNLHGKNVFVFSTSGTGNIQYNSTLIDLLKNSGASVVGNFTCRGCDTFGPFQSMGGISKGHPDSDDLAAAKNFMLQMEKQTADAPPVPRRQQITEPIK